MNVMSQLEMESHALTRFVTPREAERIKARLIQISRYWEELKNNVKQRGVELQVSSSHKMKLTEDLDEVLLHNSFISMCLYCFKSLFIKAVAKHWLFVLLL